MSELRETVSYKYTFSLQEREDNSRQLAQAQVKKTELEDEKKAAVSDFKAKIDGQDSLIKLLSRYVIDGYAYKTVQAVKKKNLAAGRWEFFHPDSAELLQTEPLSKKDYQSELPFGED